MSGYVTLDGTADHVLTADKALLDITGDLDLICLIALDDWTPATTQNLIAKWNTSNLSYRMYVSTTPRLFLSHTTDGSTEIPNSSSILPAWTDGSAVWLRVSLDVDAGASDYSVTYWYSTDPIGTAIGSVSWTTLGGDDNPAGTTSVFSGTADLWLGEAEAGGGASSGKLYGAWGYSGIPSTPGDPPSGTPAFSIDFRQKNYPYFISLDGTDDYVETSDKAQLDITGDIDIIALVAMQNWSDATNRELVWKYQASTQKAYRMYWTSGGQIGWRHSTDGSADDGFQVGNVISGSLTNGSPAWLRAHVDVSAGDYYYWYSLDDPTTAVGSVSWSSAGSDLSIGSTSIFASTSVLDVGGRSSGTDIGTQGQLFGAWVYNGIPSTPGDPPSGTLVAVYDPRTLDMTSDGLGNTWTKNGGATWGRWLDDQTNEWTLSGDAFWTAPGSFLASLLISNQGLRSPNRKLLLSERKV